MPPTPIAPPPDPLPGDELLHALDRLLGPLARLALARGLGAAQLEEALRLSLVRAADQQHAGLLPHRRVSRIATATGLHRREVARLVQRLREGEVLPAAPRHSAAAELFAGWRTGPRFCDRRGRPRVLPRQLGSADRPSFEMLAQSLTRDVHPRSLLDEMPRLGLATMEEKRDTVRLAADGFVPRGDEDRMLQFLGANVGDHLSAAVDNVLGDGRRHLEQAVFADGLSATSIEDAHALITRQWKRLHDELVAALRRKVADDQGRPDARHRLRVGLYSFEDAPPAADDRPAPSPTRTKAGR